MGSGIDIRFLASAQLPPTKFFTSCTSLLKPISEGSADAQLGMKDDMHLCWREGATFFERFLAEYWTANILFRLIKRCQKLQRSVFDRTRCC
mmetsp:Transcript_92712/g.267722  ORF Transcript_92712/g.267722 Transcript_92712/m.267722 type:complete len:92 (+) Transcript_92712:333-608(+)